jgi:Protein of unknown function (DUF3574)
MLTITPITTRSASAARFVLALLLGSTSLSPVVAQTPPTALETPAVCAPSPRRRGGHPRFRTSAAVTPCFPDGLTLLTGKGQFRESDGHIVQETSFVLVLLYPLNARKESNVKIEALRTLYKDHFQQESVLRVDDPRAVLVGF